MSAGTTASLYIGKGRAPYSLVDWFIESTFILKLPAEFNTACFETMFELLLRFPP